MKRGITVLLSVSALLVVGYFTASKWAIRHQSITFYDAERDNRPVAVDIAVRRDREMQADAGLLKLPVAIVQGWAVAAVGMVITLAICRFMYRRKIFLRL